MGIVDDLLAGTGEYLGLNRDPERGDPSAARIVVKALPGGSGVSLDYETFQPTLPDRLRPHHEHTVIARTHTGDTIAVIGHAHADTIAVMREGKPGVFELGDDGSPFPMQYTLKVPEPGRLYLAWAYGMPGAEIIDRDIAELSLVS